MTRGPDKRFADIEDACVAIQYHLTRGGIDDGTIFDAVVNRLKEIGDAVKCIPPEMLAVEPEIPWRQIAGMRDILTHRYFDTDHAIIQQALDEDIEPMLDAARRMMARLAEEPGQDRGQ